MSTTDRSKLTACGDFNPDEAMICALHTEMYAKGRHCGKRIQVVRKGGTGGQIVVTIADECPRQVGSQQVAPVLPFRKSLGDRGCGQPDLTEPLGTYSCEGVGYVDLSSGAYDKLGTREEGMASSFVASSGVRHQQLNPSPCAQFEINWSFVD